VQIVQARNNQPNGVVRVTSPADAIFLTGFVTTGDLSNANENSLTSGYPPYFTRAILSLDENIEFAAWITGNVALVALAIANTNFPKIPISGGTEIMVAFETTGAALLYFQLSSDI
jgi:hypothetical protein